MKLLLWMLFLLSACTARAERKEHSRFPLNERERIIQYVDEDQERTFCWLALQQGEEEPVVFWSREAGDSIYWIEKPGIIAAADKSGDDIFLLLAADNIYKFCIQANLETKQERMTVILGSALNDAFDLMFGGKYKMEAPNRIHGFPGFRNPTAKNRLLEWHEDGKPYLDGNPFFHISSPPVRDGYTGKSVPWAASFSPSLAPDIHVPRPNTGDAGTTPWGEPFLFLWVAGFLLLAGGVVWYYTRRVRQ